MTGKGARIQPAPFPDSLVFAIPDHPWVDSIDGAAVRIAMTSAEAGIRDGILRHVISETPGEGDGYDVELDETRGKIPSGQGASDHRHDPARRAPTHPARRFTAGRIHAHCRLVFSIEKRHG
jgi:hypothetical protein